MLISKKFRKTAATTICCAGLIACESGDNSVSAPKDFCNNSGSSVKVQKIVGRILNAPPSLEEKIKEMETDPGTELTESAKKDLIAGNSDLSFVDNEKHTIINNKGEFVKAEGKEFVNLRGDNSDTDNSSSYVIYSICGEAIKLDAPGGYLLEVEAYNAPESPPVVGDIDLDNLGKSEEAD